MKKIIKFSINTLGCKVNSYESEALICDLTKKGWLYTSSLDADVCIINTCTVTSMSDQKSRQLIRNTKKKNPNAIVVAMGCYTQLHSNEAFDIADIIIGTNEKLKVYDLVYDYLNNKKKINNVNNIFDVSCYEEIKVSEIKTHTRGFVKIQDGCENYCSYCAIPYARGKIKSRNPLFIIDEINMLVDKGVKEVIISGINTGAYGKDLFEMNLAKLIELIMIQTNVYRLRISSIELMEISDELLDVLKKNQNRIANHFHIPLQGGCDSVLERMHRKYNTKEYKNIIDKIRSLFKDVSITTDFLAGFVGESVEEFEKAKEFIKLISFSDMHIFPYSRRKGTEADLMIGHLDSKIQKERTHELLDIASTMKEKYENSFVERTFDVIVENKKDNYWRGYSSNYLDIYFKSNEENLSNKIVKLQIVKRENNRLIAIRKDV